MVCVAKGDAPKQDRTTDLPLTKRVLYHWAIGAHETQHHTITTTHNTDTPHEHEIQNNTTHTHTRNHTLFTPQNIHTLYISTTLYAHYTLLDLDHQILYTTHMHAKHRTQTTKRMLQAIAVFNEYKALHSLSIRCNAWFFNPMNVIRKNTFHTKLMRHSVSRNDVPCR
jgi:hypothetical protein